jgi:hypothetical protein
MLVAGALVGDSFPATALVGEWLAAALLELGPTLEQAASDPMAVSTSAVPSRRRDPITIGSSSRHRPDAASVPPTSPCCN